MKRDGHYAIAILCCTPFILVLPLPEGFIFLVFGVVFSISPNWELSLGITKRRGIMHTIWFSIVGSVIVFVATFLLLDFVRVGFLEIAWFTPDILKPAQISIITASGAFTGIWSHLLADSITVSGSKPSIKPLYPVSLASIHVHMFQEHSNISRYIFRTAIVILVVVYAVKLGFQPRYFQS